MSKPWIAIAFAALIAAAAIAAPRRARQVAAPCDVRRMQQLEVELERLRTSCQPPSAAPLPVPPREQLD